MSLRSSTKLLAPLCVVAHLAVLGHMVLVQHSTCPEHGELVHAEHDAKGHDAHASHAHPELPDVSAHLTRITAGESEGDNHCDVLAHRREQATPAIFAAILVEVARLVALPTPAQPLQLPSEAARYLVAPKNSPPQA